MRGREYKGPQCFAHLDKKSADCRVAANEKAGEEEKEKEKEKKGVAVFTVFYGNDANPANRVPPVPSTKYDCLFFSNNAHTLAAATRAGWRAVALPAAHDDDDDDGDDDDDDDDDDEDDYDGDDDHDDDDGDDGGGGGDGDDDDDECDDYDYDCDLDD